MILFTSFTTFDESVKNNLWHLDSYLLPHANSIDYMTFGCDFFIIHFC